MPAPHSTYARTLTSKTLEHLAYEISRRERVSKTRDPSTRLRSNTIAGNRRLPMDFRNPSLCATPSIGQPLLIPAVRTVRGCDNPLEIGAIALGRIPCSGPRREKSGEGGEERPSIIISALLDARMYVHSRAPYLWTWLEGAGRACTAPQPSGAHLLVRRSAARYLQRRANSWRGLLASLVTTVFSSWSTSIDL